MYRHEISLTTGRLQGLDVARYVAFVGMVIVNFEIVMGAEDEAGLLSFFTGALHGRAAATFVVLAGIGLGLSSLNHVGDTITVTAKRSTCLLVIGLLNMLIFEGDILHYYAFYFIFGMLLLPLSSQALIKVIAALNVVFVLMLLTLNYDAGWDWEKYSYSELWSTTGFIRNLFFNGWHPVIPWLGFLLFGIVLSRLSLGTRSVQKKLIVGGVAAIGFAEVLSFLLSAYLEPIDPELLHLLSTAPVPPNPVYFVAGLGVASVVVGISLRLSDRLERWGLLQVIVPAGRQTLTLYIGHVVVGMGTLEAVGMLGGQSVTQAFIASVAFCFAATIFAFTWSFWYKIGPIEAIMRSLAK